MGEVGYIKGGTRMLHQLDHLFLVGPGHDRVQGVYKVVPRPLEGSYMVYNTLGTCLSPRSSQESV